MSFDIFGPASKDAIKVGYISTDRGFVDGVSVCEANDYAKLNPGTRFIFRNRNVIRYLNINDVNNLTPNDIAPTEGGCSGITFDSECGPPQVYFYGGGGVGVQGNPVIGEDGSLLAIDLIEGGYGYQYEPIVEVKDRCNVGVGAVTRAVLGEIVETVEVFDREEDFEEYEICEPTDVGYGLRYGPDGQPIGPWEPTLYANLTKDPIALEIKEYQDFLRELQNPWWSTRKEAPLRMTSASKVTRTKFNVDYPAWNEFMNSFAISPVPKSNVPGSDFAGIPFTFEWEEDFPFDGEYIFRGLCDNKAELYLDNIKIDDLKSFKDSPNKIQKTVKAGVHRIRLDLLNVPIKEKVLTQKVSTTSTSTTPLQTRKVFNTIDYINRADRRLWRTFPTVGRDGDFIHQYGITPFDPNTEESNTNSYAGTHVIRWESIDFPVDGNYNIEVMVDDNVTLYIGNRIGGGKVAIGNGLNSVEQGGDEVIITKRGFSGPARSTGKTTETKFFKAGKYRIRAELEQIPGKPLAQGNPMALAVNIETSFTEEEVISAKSWNENPMGVALTIDAPMPPIPQEPIILQEGRCPNNPIWTTRFPNAKEKWWPVKYVNPPGKGPSWSKFTNRYAISPVPPLSSKGSDKGGVVYRNTWDLDIPYDGFYALKSTVDNAGRILIDDVPIMQANYIPVELRNTRGGSGALRRSGITAVDGDGIIYNWREENPKARKIFLSKGKHKIQVEVENGITETFELVDKKIFSTKDWLFPPKTTTTNAPTTTDEWVKVDDVFIPPTEQIRDRGQVLKTIPKDASFHQANEGTWYKGKRLRERGDWNNTDPYTNYIEFDSNTRLTLGSYRGFRFAIAVWNRKVTTGNQSTTTTSTAIINQSPTAAGVVYEGPTPIANYRSDFISPVFQDVNAKPNEEIQGKTWIFRWSNVDFPEDGQYTLESEADDNLIIKIDGVEVGRSKVFEGRKKTNFNITKGKRTVELELSNIRIPDTGFQQNPVVGFAQITKKVNQATGISKPWTENPMGISAILIPPPCPKRIRGKGVVTEVIVDDPGNGFPRPGTGGYPVSLRLKNVVVEDTGINYSCGIDQIQITPSNGAVLDYECDTFGRIVNVKVLNPGLGFTRYPEITIPSDTGINATFRPQFEVVRDPIVAEPQKLIQVTDLVGLKQTGYVDGRPYYGSVFYKDGISYAGFYETPGQLVQVYATLKESIDAQVTTPPSAIQRQGTDVTSNDPRLNIPGTPENLI